MLVTQEFRRVLTAGCYLLVNVQRTELGQRAGVSAKMLSRIHEGVPDVVYHYPTRLLVLLPLERVAVLELTVRFLLPRRLPLTPSPLVLV